MRTKIDYGIDLGTTNSAIARMENGKPVIKKTDTQMDTMPSCVYVNIKKEIVAGQTAFNLMKNDKVRALKATKQQSSNSFIEFKRTMGSTSKYYSSNIDKEFSSEDLSAEVLKKLKSFIGDENFYSAVITVPAKFTVPQKDATVKAAKLAGFKHVELLQEPIAASMAYGLDSSQKSAFWLVFDFGGGTFDAAVIKIEDGIMSIKDTEGDNYLGGKNIDEALVDKIIIPYLESNYSIGDVISDTDKKEILRSAVKFYAEEAKIQLSFKDSHNILTDLGDLPFEDEDGEEPVIDVNINQEKMAEIVSPIFQKAIDICKDLLKRNNLKGSDLGAIILVGGPTYSPILRKMLKEQVGDKVDTSVDPMTAVAKGAALFASTISVSDEVLEDSRDKTKIQLEIKFEPTTVQPEEYVTVKLLKDKTEGKMPDKLFIELTRGDKAWSSGKKALGEKAALIETQLNLNASNTFEITVFDEQSNKLECQPTSINIIQGISGGASTLPYNISIAVHDSINEKDLLTTVKGLEKNKELPAVGVVHGLKTDRIIKPGILADKIVIPIYQGEHNTEGTNPINSNHIYDVVITGETLPALLPAQSDVEITVKVDRSEQMKFSVFFPVLNHTEELDVKINQREPPDEDWLSAEIRRARKSLNKVKGLAPKSQVDKVEADLNELDAQLEKDKGSDDGRIKLLENLRKELRELDRLEAEAEWPVVEKELKDEFYDLENLIRKIKANSDTADLDMEKIEVHLDEYRKQIELVIKEKNIAHAKSLTTEIGTLDYHIRNSVTGGGVDVNYLNRWDSNFETIKWTDKNRAKQLINQAKSLVASGKSSEIQPLLIQINNLIAKESQDKLVKP